MYIRIDIKDQNKFCKILTFSFFFFFKLGFPPCKAEKPKGMELQEKEAQKN